MRRMLTVLFAALVLMVAGSCGDDFEYGKACEQHHQCEGGFCFTSSAGSPSGYCTQNCSEGGCPEGFLCVSFEGSNKQPACVRTDQAGAY